MCERELSNRLIVGFVLAVFCSPLTIYAQPGRAETDQPAQEATRLTPDAPIERELTGDQRHFYLIVLAAGQYGALIVDQRGIDVVVQVLGTDGGRCGWPRQGDWTNTSYTLDAAGSKLLRDSKRT